MLTWTEAISTGVDAIDKEHQMLFGKFNELEEALNSRSLDKAGEILGFLLVSLRSALYRRRAGDGSQALSAGRNKQTGARHPTSIR